MSKNGVRTTDTAVADTHGYRSSRLPSTMAVIRRRTRRLGLVATAAIVLWFATACEPAPPTATFTVNVAAGIAGDDVNPGDGVCETAPGNAQCTLDAAVQEGNALGQADINVPSAAVQGQGHVLTETITGNLRFLSVWEYQVRDFEVRAADLRIAPGGSLHVEQADLHVTRTATIEGQLSMNRGWLVGWVDVRPGGVLNLLSSIGGAWASDIPPPPTNAWITNRGTVIMRFSEINRSSSYNRPHEAAGLHTLDGGTSILGATDLHQYSLVSPNCLGDPIVSQGYNNLAGCGLSGVGDDTGTTIADIPVGTLGCGTEVTTDYFGNPRPMDTVRNGQPVRGCTRGIVEYSG